MLGRQISLDVRPTTPPSDPLFVLLWNRSFPGPWSPDVTSPDHRGSFTWFGSRNFGWFRLKDLSGVWSVERGSFHGSSDQTRLHTSHDYCRGDGGSGYDVGLV